MSPWNRLRHLAGRLLAGGEGGARPDEAIYLTDEAYRNRRSGPASAPEIRERHFGLGVRRERTERDPVRPRGLLARLGLRRDRTGVDDPHYVGTRIRGTPHPARKADTPPRRKAAAPAATEPKPAGTLPQPPARPPLAAPVAAAAPSPAPAGEPPASPPVSAAPKTVPSGDGKAGRPAIPAPRAPLPSDDELLKSLFGEAQKTKGREPSRASSPAPAPAPAPAKKAKKKKKMDRGDVTVAALGVTLAAVCAVFPWYIFFNQEKFGVREFVFSGGGTAGRSTGLAYQPQPIGKPFSAREVPTLELDFFPTATLSPDQEGPRAVPVSEQPFPADRASFRLIHVANGRAMIEDGDGLWVVQRGSRLPDASRVVAIEQREGRWVLVTSNDGIVEIETN